MRSAAAVDAGVRTFLKAAGATLSIVALAVGLGTATAGAEEVTRAGYREAAEPICRANTEANERILAGVRGEVRQGQLDSAARRFSRASRALRGTVAELKAIPRPLDDQARLSRWLGFVSAEAELLKKTSRYLAAGKKGAAAGMVVRLKGVASRANNAVFAFEFDYCKFDPARFT
ncbi:MAG TPA: hypothetical protein VN732_03220 [Solirubrobacterales bacterium]|nr:hypothetical protein [Solirubrobacterales bacterium]